VQTSIRNNGIRGFTLIEMTVILVVLVIIAAAIVPNVVSVLQSEQLKSTEATLARLPDGVRNDAIKGQNPIRVHFDGSTMVEEELMPDGTIQQYKTIDLGSSVQVDQVQKNYQVADPSTWYWTAFPDGTSDIGGVQFTVDSEQESLIIPSFGKSVWQSGPLPDETEDQWTAGQLQLRTTT
jgi:Tfp pilus assembly protein FimT